MIIGDKVVYEKLENDCKKMNLLLDLDSTIIHSKRIKNGIINFNDEFCHTVLCEFMSCNNYYQIHVRNDFSDFLLELLEHFNIYIYTMAKYEYAVSVCKSIEKLLDKSIFSGIVARYGESRGQYKYFYSLKYFDVTNTIIIDDRDDVWINDNKKNVVKINKFLYTSFSEYMADNNLKTLKNLIVEHIEDIKNNKITQTIEKINNIYQHRST